MSNDLSRNSHDNEPSTSGVSTRYSSSPEITNSSNSDRDFKNVKIQDIVNSKKKKKKKLESDSCLSDISIIKNSKENLDKYPNNPTSKVVYNANGNMGENSRTENNSIQNQTPTVSSHKINDNSSSSKMEIDINVIPSDHSDEEYNKNLEGTSKTYMVPNILRSALSHKRIKTSSKSLLPPSNSYRDHKSPHDSEPEFKDTAFIIVPSITEKVDPAYSYIVSDSKIQNYIKEAKMMEADNIVDAYDSSEIDEIINDEIILGTRYYLVKWKKWSKGFNTWERYGALYKSQKILHEYIQNKKQYGNKFKHSINGLLLLLSRKMITKLFDLFRTETGLSLPAYLPENINGLFNSLDVGPPRSQRLKNKCFQSFLATISLGYLRQQQLVKLKQWEIDINVVTQGYQIKVENNIDLEGPPNVFVYITEYVPLPTITIPDDPPIGCTCKKNCQTAADQCCYEMSGCSKAYDRNKNIIVSPGNPVFECNKKCKCSSLCPNRVVQLGSKVNVCIYKTRRCGWGVKTTQNIQKGQFVARYIGEIITVEESEERLKNNYSMMDYMWNLDFDDPQNYKYIIDGTHFANFTYFINHSCNANLDVYAVWINCLDRNLPQIALFANRYISAGEQLTANYFSRSTRNSEKRDGVRCKCDMKNCHGYYF
ncbi:histone-lysine N-methyltransferase SUV39H2-like [Melanaphis sacchari]|uniref:Histone-lysine N-methyltransferase SUV39H2 n=1 Tax=Melanaphis sacchari TaxID=742174 RepID=A0A2H8TKC4_9HEMI|nr:histone-lysine N-methyltransferase SUV39H2-like [Melanaphis sacchari]